MFVKSSKYLGLITLSVLIIGLAGCSREKQEKVAEKPGAVNIAIEKPAQPQDPVTSIKGKVLEVVDTGSFVFILLEMGEKQIWATLPSLELKIGEEVTLLNANITKNFSSQSMNRFFDELIFSTGIEGQSEDKRVTAASRKEILTTPLAPVTPASPANK